jgi:hypothetical protein
LYPAGSQISFDLNGGVTNFSTDTQSDLSSYSPAGSDGQDKVWIVSAAAIRARLNALNTFHLGGILLNDLLTPGNDTGIFTVLSEYKDNLPSSIPAQLSLQWDISDGSGAVANQTTGIGTPMVWQADADGSYVVRGAVVGGRNSDRGSVNLQVGAPATTPPPVVVQSSGGGSSAPPPAAATTAAPPPVSGTVGGGFEVGGQTNGTGAFGAIHSARMSWVKFQHKWSPGESPSSVADLIQQAHASGLKVLISIPGNSHPASIDYNAYVSFVQGVAGLGADGIEIWNEMNLQREWPMDQMNGATYTNQMLKPAYQAIKSSSPNTLVIAGALAPTGYWGLDGCGYAGSEYGCSDYLFLTQMRDAGAGSAMDCLGAHYNEGIIPPSQQSGDPRDYDYYTRYLMGNGMLNTYYVVIGKPMCFTELGYLTGDGYGSLPSSFGWAASTSVDEQAQWLADAAVLLSQSKKARLMIIFNVDFTVWGDDPQAGYAMVRPGGGCPACAALAAVLP